MVAAALAFVLLAGQEALPKPLVGVHKIVVMGDSITELGGPPKGYVALIDQTLKQTYPSHPIEVVNAGISGQKAPDMLARFREDVIDEKPEIVTLSVGVNDVWHNFRNAAWTARVPGGNSGRGVALPDYLAKVDAMIQAAQKARIRIILVSPTLVYEDLNCAENRRLSEYVKAEEALAKKRKVGYINLNGVFRKVVGSYQREAGSRQLLLTVDGVHMNDAGNALMADEILRSLGVPIPNGIAAK